jgi:hypothetical protein
LIVFPLGLEVSTFVSVDTGSRSILNKTFLKDQLFLDCHDSVLAKLLRIQLKWLFLSQLPIPNINWVLKSMLTCLNCQYLPSTLNWYQPRFLFICRYLTSTLNQYQHWFCLICWYITSTETWLVSTVDT